MEDYSHAEKEILRIVHTKEEADIAIELLDMLESGLFESSDRFLAVLEKEAPFWMSSLIRDIYEREKGNKDVLKNFFLSLRDQIRRIPLMTLELAFEPSRDLVSFLSRWARENAGATVLLDIRVIPAICGGIRVAFGGRYKEHTLKSRIEMALQKARPMVGSHLKNNNGAKR